MSLIKPNIENIGFDDRKMMIIGMILYTLTVPYLFFDGSFGQYLKDIHYQIFLGSVFVIVDWLAYRWLLIKMRQKYPKIVDTHKRIFILLLIVFATSPIISKILKCVINFFSEFIVGKDICTMKDLQSMVTTYFIAFGIIAAYEAIYFFMKYKKSIQEKERLQTAHVQTQLDNLRNQINPHFLFNSLNTLMNLIPKDQDRAMGYLEKLSTFYRYSVGNKDEHLVSVKEEMKNAEIYADLLRERFGDNIHITFMNGVTDNQMTLPMSLQLLIENAVKHNIVSKNKPLQIDVTTCEEGNYLCVKNNLQKKIQSVTSTGMGLDNIKERFKFFTDKEVQIMEQGGQFEVALPIVNQITIKK